MARSPSETPLMRQYLDLKEKHADALLFFRCGDFYEMFFEDAVVAARALDLTLTSRDKGKEDAVPMCGVPYHAARGYLARLTEQGFKVAVCEQMEDPKLAKGLVKREVVRVITPGVVLDDEILDPKLPRYLAALVPAGKKTNGAGGRPVSPMVGLAYLDATTGELCATEVQVSSVLDELMRVGPREVLADAAQLEGMLAPVRARYRMPWNPAAVPVLDAAVAELGPLLGRPSRGASATVAGARGDGGAATARGSTGAGGELDPDERPLAVRAAATVLAYARATQPGGTLPVTRLIGYEPGDAVVLDETAIANLELTETLIGRKREGALLDVIDQTVTAPGGRLLRRWMLYPLIDVAQIRRRQDAVGWLVQRPALLEQVRRTLSRVADLERLAGKATLGVATPRDLGRLRDALGMLPEVIALVKTGATKLEPVPPLLDPAPPAFAGSLHSGLASCADAALPALAVRLNKSLVDEPPFLVKDGGVIRAGWDAQVDECRRLADGGKDEILAIEAREQRESGIANLKVRYNRVFGYYLEITKSNLAKVPAHYVRKQTIANGERYVTPELAELERKVVTAEETLAAREAELFKAEVTAVAEVAAKVSAAGAALAVVDACASLAEVAARRGYCRPVVDDRLAIEIVDGRHPVIEAMLPDGTFVPNDCKLAAEPSIGDRPDAEQLVLITGPNMAGKSTYMRQVAQIALLAQIGSFVPAKAATIGVCDRVFTRVGAADNLSRGDSTFMVEMRETAAILAHATRRSLVILDEVGRGTSTFDGVSIAWAVAEHIHDQVGARTLFATHYHELVALADSRPRVRNVSVAVREHKGEIVFLRRVVPGGANRSYGIDVARLAGLPGKVIGRAREIMSRLEGGSQLGTSAQLSLGAVASAHDAPGTSPQLRLGIAALPSPIVAKLSAIDVNRMTPLEALTLLAELKALV